MDEYDFKKLPSIEQQIDFFNSIQLPRAPLGGMSRSFSSVPAVDEPDDRKQSASVIKDTLLSCMTGLSREEQREVKNSIRLARLVSDEYENQNDNLADWMKQFAYTLNHVGWHLKSGMFDKTYKEYFTVSRKMFDTVAVLGNEPLLNSNLAAFAALKSNPSALLGYSQASVYGQSFQVAPVGRDSEGNITLVLSHARLSAQRRTSQFLFLEWGDATVELRHHYASFTLERAVYAQTKEKTEAIITANRLQEFELEL